MMAAIVVAFAVVTAVFGERIGINAGQGWDGENYMRWSGDFWHRVVELGVSRFQAQRVLVSAIIYYAVHPLGVTPTVAHYVIAFEVLDVVMLAGAAIIWANLGAVMKWRACATWLGFIALFGGFANARHALYDPVLIDSTAFALGMVMVWAYLSRRPFVTWIVALLGAVSWPALPIVAIAMLVLPRPMTPVSPVADAWRPRLGWIAAALAFGATSVFLAIASHYYNHPVAVAGDDKLAAWVRGDWLGITLPLLATALAVPWYLLAREPRLWNVRGHVRELTLRYVVLACAAVIAWLLARTWWLATAGTLGEGATRAQFLCEHTLGALRGPLWGIVYHVVYFGPIILFAAFTWRRIAVIAAEWGPAAVFALALVVAFAGGSQSRQWIHLLPLLVAVTVAATHDLWTPRRVAMFAALALPWSKVWLAIHYDTPGDWHAFPSQRYFMQIGPYASDATYTVHLVAVAITAVIVGVMLRSWTGARRAAPPAP